MKNFIESAKKNLQQITSLEMSPDDRLRMTKDLQNQVKARMVTLDQLERDAQWHSISFLIQQIFLRCKQYRLKLKV